MLTEVLPLFGLRLRTPRLELRLPSLPELAELAELAAEGIHDPAVMPFLTPWTDHPPAEVARSVVQYNLLQLGKWTARDWTLSLVVFRDGVVVGNQGIAGEDLAVTREVNTGSWLGRRHQGQGLGTEMRAAVLHLAFDGLAAEEAVSGAMSDNERSLGVSLKLGYQRDGVRRLAVRDELAVEQRLRLTRASWERQRTVPVTIDGLTPCLPLFGLG
jgi:RimJ/RimL family protein N-acetyltransferase